jgi:ATP-binding cassette subfamily F protein 3
MSVISASNICKYYGIDDILTEVSFNVNEGDRIGIVGANGAGKSTLIKILVGELEPDEGQIYLDRSKTVGYLQQRDHFPDGGTVMEEMKQALTPAEQQAFFDRNGYSFESGIRGMLTSLAFSEDYFDKPVGLLSGGERTRLALAATLLKHPNILLLDEPTNHLDIGTLKWLEDYLKGYRGTILVISHDRYFLDKIVTRIFEIENTRLTAYDGNYTVYKEKKQQRYDEDLKHYEQQMEEIKRQEELIARWKGRGTEKLVRRAQSREKRLAHVERPVKPTMLRESLKINFSEKLQSGNDVLYIEDMSMSFTGDGGTRRLFENVKMDIKKGDRICLVGPNGIGKTTLLKIILGQLQADSGYMTLGQNVVPGYYDQEQKLLNTENTVLEELHSTYRKYNVQDLRNILGSFLFHGDDVFKKVGDLAGGEKARLSLLKLMMSGANFLLFDEPTNHLDISAKEVFEEALLAFPGTILIVSHDRYLLQRIPTAIYELGPEGISVFLGGYDYYSEKRETVGSGRSYLKNMGVATSYINSEKQAAAASEEIKRQLSKEERIRAMQEEKQRQTEARRKERQLKEAEAKVQELEAQAAALEEELCRPEVFADAAKAKELAERLGKTKEELDNAYEKWMELQE